jgi:hypothetical protein
MDRKFFSTFRMWQAQYKHKRHSRPDTGTVVKITCTKPIENVGAHLPQFPVPLPPLLARGFKALPSAACKDKPDALVYAASSIRDGSNGCSCLYKMCSVNVGDVVGTFRESSVGFYERVRHVEQRSWDDQSTPLHFQEISRAIFIRALQQGR